MYANTLGIYSGSSSFTTTQVPPGDIPHQDDPWWEDAFTWLGNTLFGSEYPKPLPPALPFTVGQVRSMFDQLPYIEGAVVQKMKGQGHTAIYLGHQPTAATWEDPQTVAELALWFANGTGDDLSRGEAQIRELVLNGMRQLAPATGGQPGPGPGTGGGSGGNGIPGTQANVGALVGLALLGAGIYMATR